MKSGLDHLAAIAEAQVGLCEEPRGSNRGPKLKKFFAADNYVPGPGGDDGGYPWCAAFVCWCVQEFLRGPEGGRYSQIRPPRTARAFGLIDWARELAPRCTIFSPGGTIWPQRGDIVVFRFSHVGIVTAAGTHRHLTSVEGNTDKAGSREGWEVAKRPRVFGLVKAFIRMRPDEKGGDER